MSSVSSSYSLDFTSPTTDLLPILPSTSELLAQERFTNLVRPCFQHIFKFLQQIHPLSNLLKHLYQYKDEFILIIESILQWFYLHFHSALIGEHFYGLKRTANHRLRSLILSVFLPYIKLKLHAFQHQMRENNADEHAKYFIILQLLPKLQVEYLSLPTHSRQYVFLFVGIYRRSLLAVSNRLCIWSDKVL